MRHSSSSKSYHWAILGQVENIILLLMQVFCFRWFRSSASSSRNRTQSSSPPFPRNVLVTDWSESESEIQESDSRFVLEQRWGRWKLVERDKLKRSNSFYYRPNFQKSIESLFYFNFSNDYGSNLIKSSILYFSLVFTTAVSQLHIFFLLLTSE